MTGFQKVAGYCPMGCGRTLFLGSDDYVTCSWHKCPNPVAASNILDDAETEHVVVLGEETFTVRHPLRERLNGGLEECSLHQWLSALDGPPRKSGRYRARRASAAARWTFEDLAP